MRTEEAGYRIVQIDSDDRSEAIRRFVVETMEQLYPEGGFYTNPPDLARFRDVYVYPANARFFVAEQADGQLAGTAAVRPYDGRFSEMQTHLGEGPICEMVKFYIAPKHRRAGLGRRLYSLAEQFAQAAGYRESYLHTSLFLPGGYPFWQTRGYKDRYWESGDTVHMSKML